MTRVSALLSSLALVIGGQVAPGPTIVGTIDGLTSEKPAALVQFQLSSDRNLPGLTEGDRVFRATTRGGAVAGMLVAFVERAAGGVLFVDRNFDGHLTADESMPVAPGSPFGGGPDTAFELKGAPGLPFRCRVVGNRDLYAFEYTATFRLEGHADIGGRRTLVTLPYLAGSGGGNVRVGMIGLDANGDGTIDLSRFSGPEVVWAGEKPALFRVAGHVVSVESVNMEARTFVLREHPLDAYKYVDLRVGDAMPAFSYTDFDGRSRKLADFRGKYVLLDFWGTWCGPCLAEIPNLRTARERFADRGFEILGIDYEKGGGTLEQARAVVQERGVTWPNATPASVKDLVEDRLRIMSFPTKILIGPDGKVVAFLGFEITGGELLRRLDSLIR